MCCAASAPCHKSVSNSSNVEMRTISSFDEVPFSTSLWCISQFHGKRKTAVVSLFIRLVALRSLMEIKVTDNFDIFEKYRLFVKLVLRIITTNLQIFCMSLLRGTSLLESWGNTFFCQLTATLNLCLLYFKITWTLAIL